MIQDLKLLTTEQKVIKHTTTYPTIPCEGLYTDTFGIGLTVECNNPIHTNTSKIEAGDQPASLQTTHTDPRQTHTTRARIHEQSSFSLGNCDYFE